MRAINSLAVVLGLSISLLGAEDKQEVSFQLLRDYVIVVRGSIEGESDLHFIVDTGAVPSVFDKRLVKHLKLIQDEQLLVFSKSMNLTLAQAATITVGPWRQAEFTALVADLSFASEALGVRIDGLLGLDFFGTSFSIDYHKKKLRKIGDTYEGEDGDVIIRHAPDAWFATVEMTFAGRTLKLLADSGTSDLVFFRPRVLDCLGSMSIVGSATWSNMGGELAMQRVRLQGASIAGRPWLNRDALVMDASKGPQGLDGMLGLSSVGARRVVFLPPTVNADISSSHSASPR